MGEKNLIENEKISGWNWRRKREKIEIGPQSLSEDSMKIEDCRFLVEGGMVNWFRLAPIDKDNACSITQSWSCDDCNNIIVFLLFH